MATTEERLATLETDMRNEREWRRAILEEMRAGFSRLDAKIDRLFILLLALLITIIGGIIAVVFFGG